jgi:hypothetical protein
LFNEKFSNTKLKMEKIVGCECEEKRHLYKKNIKIENFILKHYSFVKGPIDL